MKCQVICLPPQEPRFDLEDDQSPKIRAVLCVPIKNHGGEVAFISRGVFVCFYIYSDLIKYITPFGVSNIVIYCIRGCDNMCFFVNRW